MSEVRIVTEPRTEFGKGAARRTRREGKVPAVLYGHGTDPVHLTLPGHDLMLALKNANVLLSLVIQGRTQLALPKEVQRDPIKGFLRHVDLLVVNRGEKVTVDVPVQTTGTLAPGGGLLELDLTALPVLAEATHIPEHIEVSIDGLDIGASVTAGEVTLPAGIELAVERDTPVLHVIAPQAAEPVAGELTGEGEQAAEG